jgi:hypothetical protein
MALYLENCLLCICKIFLIDIVQIHSCFTILDFQLSVCRRTVSNFLVSDFRESMDRLMSSRLERTMHSEEEEEEHGSQGRMDQLMSFLQRHRHLSGSHEEEENGEGEEVRDVAEEEPEGEEDRDGADEEEEGEEEEEESLIGGQYNEASDYFDQSSSLPQMPSPSQLWSWTDRDNEVSDDSEVANSTSQSPHLLSQPYHQDSQQNPSSTNQNSTVSFTFISL